MINQLRDVDPTRPLGSRHGAFEVLPGKDGGQIHERSDGRGDGNSLEVARSSCSSLLARRTCTPARCRWSRPWTVTSTGEDAGAGETSSHSAAALRWLSTADGPQASTAAISRAFAGMIGPTR